MDPLEKFKADFARLQGETQPRPKAGETPKERAPKREQPKRTNGPAGAAPPPVQDPSEFLSGADAGGDTDPATDAPLELDPRDPMRSARALVAAHFTDEEQHRLLHHHRGGFYRFDGSCYRDASANVIQARIWEFLERAMLKDKEDAAFKPTRNRVADVAAALAAACHLDDRINPPAWLDKARSDAAELLPVANGLLHLPTGKLTAATPAYFGLTASVVHFDPKAPRPEKWLAFLHDLFQDDAEAVAALQDWFGYSLSPDTSQQKILLVVGPKRGGKGTIARVLTALLGHDNVAAPTLASLQTNFGVAPLIGKPLAIVSDARLGGRSDQAAITERLLSISGEDGLTIDRKFLPAWTGSLPTRFMLLTNELPRLADSSGALAGRFIVLVLVRSFYGCENPRLTGELLTELSGIMNWARAGYLRLRDRGYFEQPASGCEAIEQLETLGSPVTAFVRDRCAIDAAFATPCELLHQTWRAWCETTAAKNLAPCRASVAISNRPFPLSRS
jgi:putative DNA primase/helicase